MDTVTSQRGTALHRLLYRGPTLGVLHEQYAKKGRIDEEAPVVSTAEVHIEAPVERVWALLSAPGRWDEIDPDIHDVVLNDGVHPDASFRWTNGRIHITSRLAVVEPMRELTWTGSAFGAKSVHRHLLHDFGDGTTRLTTEESMAGPFLVWMYSPAKLTAVLQKWLMAVRTAAERQ